MPQLDVLLVLLFAGIAAYSQNLKESISALCIVLLVVAHLRTMRITEGGERFGTPGSSAVVSMAFGVLLIVAIFYAWSYAIKEGGLWWLLFLVVGYTCLKIGESFKRGLEAAVKDSKDEQKTKDIQAR